MKNTIKKINVGLLAIVLGLGLVFTQSAFKSTRLVQTWVFTQTNSTNIHDAQNYELNAPQDECDALSSYPCKLEVDNSIDTQAKLATYLAGKTNAQIMAASIGKVRAL